MFVFFSLSLGFLLKMDNILLITIKASDSDKVHTVEINPSKYVTDATDFSSNIVSKFSDLNALVELIKTQIIGKVIPSGSNSTNNNNFNDRENPYYADDPLRAGPPRRPFRMVKHLKINEENERNI